MQEFEKVYFEQYFEVKGLKEGHHVIIASKNQSDLSEIKEEHKKEKKDLNELVHRALAFGVIATVETTQDHMTLEAIENNNLYDYVGNNAHNLSKEDLSTMVKELSYSYESKATKQEFKEELTERLYLSELLKDSMYLEYEERGKEFPLI